MLRLRTRSGRDAGSTTEDTGAVPVAPSGTPAAAPRATAKRASAAYERNGPGAREQRERDVQRAMSAQVPVSGGGKAARREEGSAEDTEEGIVTFAPVAKPSRSHDEEEGDGPVDSGISAGQGVGHGTTPTIPFQ